MSAPARTWQVRGETLTLGGRPLLMGIVNATPDSFSDGGERTLEERVSLTRSLLEAGAQIIDIGGESGVTNRPPISARGGDGARRAADRAGRRLSSGARVSVDTYKPAVARAAIDAGASIINDVSGLRDPKLAEVCADDGRRADPDAHAR